VHEKHTSLLIWSCFVSANFGLGSMQDIVMLNPGHNALNRKEAGEQWQLPNNSNFRPLNKGELLIDTTKKLG
jgi:hypothetical protein